jgi:hypothetical protein
MFVIFRNTSQKKQKQSHWLNSSISKNSWVMKKLLSLLAMVLFVFSSTANCLYKDNSFIEFTLNSNKTARFTYFGKGTKGWKGLIFSESEEPSETSLFLVAHPEKVVQLTFPNLTKTENTTITKEEYETSILVKLDDLTSFKFSVDLEKFNQWKFISFVESEKDNFVNKDGIYVGYDHITTVPFNITTYSNYLFFKF